MDDWTFFEKFLAALSAAGLGIAVWSRSMANLGAKVVATEKDITELKQTHDKQLDAIHQSVKELRVEMKADVHELWTRSEERHNSILKKLDDIARGMK